MQVLFLLQVVVALVVVVLTIGVEAEQALPLPRGVDPKLGITTNYVPLPPTTTTIILPPTTTTTDTDKATRYQDATWFHCGQVQLPRSAINDNYCDCPEDGSDEPGTSACSRGSFYCRNMDLLPRSIPSSRVWDGICDCCDGSDEWREDYASTSTSSVKCPNVCQEQYQRELHHQQQRNLAMEKGTQLKREAIEWGERTKMERQHQVLLLEESLVKLDAQLVTLQAEKERCEEVEQKLAKLMKQQRVSQQDVQCRQQLRNLTQRWNQLRTQLVLLQDTQLKALQEIVDASSEEVQVDTHQGEEEEEEEERGAVRLVEKYQQAVKALLEAVHDAKWEQLKELEVEPEVNVEEDPSPKEDHSSWTTLLGDYYETCGQPLVQRVSTWIGFPSTSTTPSPKNMDYAAAKQAADQARTAHSTAQTNRQQTHSQLTTLQKKLQQNYGKEEEFAQLDGSCFSFPAGEYTYEACPFGEATQNNAHGVRVARLGSWQEWSKEASNDYSLWKFTSGDTCWNGPQRSLTIHVSCGAENKILSATEPSKCEYHMEMTSPLVCPSPHRKEAVPPEVREEL